METIATAFWRRLDVPGRDAARVSRTADGFQLVGQAVFLDARGPAALRYELDLASDWSTREGRINGFVGDQPVDTRIVRADGWLMNGKNHGMADVLDLDLGFTPATNMVQLRRVHLAVGERTAFDVAWLDTGDDRLIRLPQTYVRSSDSSYAYESPMSSYKATLRLDATGFAEAYPGLWEIQR